MLRKKINFFTDCYIFGGCEKPIFELISSPSFLEHFDYKVTYRYSKEYLDGLHLNFPGVPEAKTRKVHFFEIHSWNILLKRKIANRALGQILSNISRVVFHIFGPFLFVYELFCLYFLFLREKADIIHINNGGYPGMLSCRAAAIAARCAGQKKIIFSVNNLACKESSIFERIIDFFVRKSINMIITGSNASRLSLSLNRGFKKEVISRIYHGFRQGDNLETSVHSTAKLRSNKHFYISMVALFEERKGHRYALSALKKLIDEHPEYSGIKLAFIGNGPLEQEIQGFVIKENLVNNVEFLGYRNDYLDYVASSLFLLNPSLGFEDLPYIIIESMSLGVPVIGTSVGGIPEEIEDGVSGFVVPAKDTDALCKAMFSLLCDEQKRVKMAEAARQRFLKLFTADKMAAGYIELYNKICES